MEITNTNKINHLTVDYSNNDYFQIHVSRMGANGYWINPDAPDDDDYTWGVIAENIARLLQHNTVDDHDNYDDGVITITADDVVVATISGVDGDADDAVKIVESYIYATVNGIDVDEILNNLN